MTFLTHIGMPKAGSKALQRSLFCNRDYLLKHRVLYPASRSEQASRHHYLSYLTQSEANMPTAIRLSAKTAT